MVKGPGRLNVSCRRYEQTDRDALVAMLGRIEQFKSDEIDVAMELLDLSVSDPVHSGYEALVATVAGDDTPVGYVCFGPTPMTRTTWDLYWIATDPAFRGAGVGRVLHESALASIGDRGGRLVRLETSTQESYAATIAFYDAAGYQLVSRVDGFYEPDDALLTYFLRLPDRD